MIHPHKLAQNTSRTKADEMRGNTQMTKNCMVPTTSMGTMAIAVFFEKTLRYHGRLIVGVASAGVVEEEEVLAFSLSPSVKRGGVSVRLAVRSCHLSAGIDRQPRYSPTCE